MTCVHEPRRNLQLEPKGSGYWEDDAVQFAFPEPCFCPCPRSLWFGAFTHLEDVAYDISEAEARSRT